MSKTRQQMPSEHDLLETLTGVHRVSNYDQGGDFSLLFELCKVMNPALLERVLQVAHLNGLREATERSAAFHELAAIEHQSTRDQVISSWRRSRQKV